MVTWSMDRLNEVVADSIIGKRFKLTGSKHPNPRKDAFFTRDIMAGLTTFFAMAYIISVNATILADSGGGCYCPRTDADFTCSIDPDYQTCLLVIKRDFITGTAAISALTTFCMGLFANMPIALAPGMGLNAYFTYTVVGFHGSGPVTYQLALTAVFVEGFIFVALSLLGLRQWLARLIPPSIKLASGVGIGLYLTIIGMTYSAGIGLITGAKSTPLELAGCLIEQLDDTGVCPGAVKMRSGKMWVGIFCGGFVTALLIAFKFKGAIMVGILLTAIVSWPRTSDVTYFPDTTAGNSNFDFFKKVVTFHPIGPNTLNQNQWSLEGVGGQFGLALITFLYVDIMDCTGTLYSMARFSGVMDEKTQDFEGSAVAYLVDAMGISIGSLMGLSPVTAFVESGAGIAAGGKTGITAMTTGLCFFISIFFAPIFASIPPWATGPTLIIVGAMMCTSAKDINWNYIGDSLPAFITLATMPFTYSIAYGLIGGIASYIIINVSIWLITKASMGKLQAVNFEQKEFWTWRPVGGFLPPYMRAAGYKMAFWKEKSFVVTQPNDFELEPKDRTTTSDDEVMGSPSESPSSTHVSSIMVSQESGGKSLSSSPEHSRLS